MRIIAGKYKGRRLNVPKGRDIRPTSDKIRGAVFNMLHSRGAIENAHVLDAFCGSGALGLEALSRGAKSCVFVDKHRASLESAKANAQALAFNGEIEFWLKDSTKLGPRPEHISPFDLLFLDPPYHKDLVNEGLNALFKGKWLSRQAWIMCETEKMAKIDMPEHCCIDDEKTYGDIKITVLQYKQD
ncbi:MAG: 16S rRNA (guanine(966)-N(2))-methyltransferase RsmD [Alphaproteobacteria bacterium]|nr:16S rRNA (guanine(966)-N(2))-methyltransferase RsmD [Alphaproteobacteria bacterium]